MTQKRHEIWGKSSLNQPKKISADQFDQIPRVESEGYSTDIKGDQAGFMVQLDFISKCTDGPRKMQGPD